MADDQKDVGPPNVAAAVALPGAPAVDVLAAGAGSPTGNPSAGGLEEVGVSGLKVYSGYLNEEFLHELRGLRAIPIYRQMSEGDSTVVAMLQAISLIIRAVDWRIEPADDSSAAETEAVFVEQVLDDMSHPLEDTVGEILSMLVYGWSYHEIVLKIRRGPDEDDGAYRSKYTDGRIGIRKLPIRSQDSLLRWEMQADGGILGMWQQSPSGGQLLFIPIERALLFRTGSRKNNPEGVSILRSSYRAWYMKKNVEDFEAIGIERELAGLPVVSIPKRYFTSAESADKAFLAKAEKIARDLKFNQQGGVVIPSDHFINKTDGNQSSVPLMEIKLLSSGGKRSIETGPVVERYSRDIVRAALADFLTLGDQKGSYALSKNKSELFLRAVESYLNQIAAVFNRFLLPRLWAYNGLDRKLMPKMAPGRVAPEDLNEVGAYVQALAAAGMPLFPDDKTEEFLREIAGLPEPATDSASRMAAGFGQDDNSSSFMEQGAPGGGAQKRDLPFDKAGDYDESKHPRDDHGRWTVTA
jgi:hypothetical protein